MRLTPATLDDSRIEKERGRRLAGLAGTGVTPHAPVSTDMLAVSNDTIAWATP